jgi:hypothetical protein
MRRVKEIYQRILIFSLYWYAIIPSILRICFGADNVKINANCVIISEHVARFRVSLVVFPFNTVIYVFLLLYLIVCLCIHCIRMYLFYVYVFIVCLCIFIVPAGTLLLPRLRFFRAFSSVLRQMPGKNP